MLIQKHGVQGTSISQVVDASHTSAGAIYHHFANKNAIVVEVARATIAIPLEALAAYSDTPASPAQLAGFAMGALNAAPEIGEVLAQLGAGAIADDDLGLQLRAEFSVLRDAVDQTMRAWAKMNSVSAARVEGYSQLLTGLTLGYASQKILTDGFDEMAYMKQAAAMLELPQSASGCEESGE